MKLGFVGCGNMAGAMMGGIIKNNIFKAEDVYGSDVFEPSRERVKNMYGIHVSDNNVDVVDAVDVLVLAVKPQYYESVITQIKDHVRADQLIITIAPGKTLSWLAEKFGKDVKIVRTMPNTPMKIGLGVCGLYSTPEADPDHRFIVKVFAACGDLIWCTKEEELDGVTAISGSGPAYVFRFIEALTEAGLRYGFNDVQAKRMAIATVLGSAELAKRSGESPSVLREKVTSKGGTTYEALKVMNDRHFMEMMQDAMDACKKRAVELGDAFHESVEASNK